MNKLDSSGLIKLFKNDPGSPPWPRMILCCFATTLPLIVGLVYGQLSISIYGSLGGYLLMLNDHLGTFRKRVENLSFTFLLLLAGFAVGILLHGRPIAFYICVTGLTYWIGILGGDGAELERAVLFSVISVIISFFSKAISFESLLPLFLYTLLAYLSALVAMPILIKLKPRPPDPFLSFRESFQISFAKSREKYVHAASYTLASLLAIWIAQHFQIERGYWVVVTVLLVMRADRSLSLLVTGQRLVGTALGVLLFDLLVLCEPSLILIVLWIAVCAFLIPYFTKRNYLYASLFITAFVVSLLQIGNLENNTFDTHIAFVRLKATVIGCALSVVGSLISKILCKSRAPNKI